MIDITLKDLKLHKDALFCKNVGSLYDDTLLFDVLLITLILINP